VKLPKPDMVVLDDQAEAEVMTPTTGVPCIAVTAEALASVLEDRERVREHVLLACVAADAVAELVPQEIRFVTIFRGSLVELAELLRADGVV